MNTCERIQQRLAELGTSAMQDHADLRQHVSACTSCTKFLQELRALESAVAHLPDDDAPATLVQDTLAAVAKARETGQGVTTSDRSNRRWATGLASAAVILATVGLSLHVLDSLEDRVPMVEEPMGEAVDAIEAPQKNIKQFDHSANQHEAPDSGELASLPATAGGAGSVAPTERVEEERHYESTQATNGRIDRNMAKVDQSVMAEDRQAIGQETLGAPRLPDEDGVRGADDKPAFKGAGYAQQETGTYRSRNESLTSEHARAASDPMVAPTATFFDLTAQLANSPAANAAAMVAGRTEAPAAGPSGAKRSELGQTTVQTKPAASDQVVPTTPGEDGRGSLEEQVAGERREQKDNMKLSRKEVQKRKSMAKRGAAIEGLLNSGDELITGDDYIASRENFEVTHRPSQQPMADVESQSETTVNFGLRGGPAHSPSRLATENARYVARAYLAELDRTEGHAFAPPAGHWANTYVPGDPVMRALRARLAGWDRVAINASNPGPGLLETAAQRVDQPFDVPGNAALAVFLQSDAASIDERTRMRVQVGIKGAERQGGRRPVMHVALVLDHPLGVSAAAQRGYRALLLALQAAQQPGDRFSVVVAGQPGGVVVPPESFRHGPLRVAMQQLFTAGGPANTPTLNRPQALRSALDSVRDDSNAADKLGASLVLLASALPSASDLPELKQIAHHAAVEGITLSVVGVGKQAPVADIDQLVLSGQGNRRLLDTPDQAGRLINRELHAAARVVARALRLNIRLAPGVELVNVIGSERLDQARIDRVREAEHSIDQRLARNFGIQADRDDDDQGVQILIPAFYAGDTHVILLDLVAAKAGPVIDVSARYKDLVHLRNNVARANLTLPRGSLKRGPLQRNVLKNLLATKLSESVWKAGQYLAENKSQQAVALLTNMHQLLRGLRAEVEGWDNDQELINDESMIAEYLTVLDLPISHDIVQRAYLADSLRYAALRKLLLEL